MYTVLFCKERTNSASNTTENSVVYKLFFYALLQQNKYGEEERNTVISRIEGQQNLLVRQESSVINKKIYIYFFNIYI